jgi:hypothetical protein
MNVSVCICSLKIEKQNHILYLLNLKTLTAFFY